MNIFITGGTSGIGLGLATRYLDQGHRVGVCGRSAQKFQQNVSAEYRNKIHFYEVDILKLDQLKNAVKEFCRNDRLDLMIANAGISSANKSSIPNFDKSREVININVIGLINTFEVALEFMNSKFDGSWDFSGRQFVAISSVAGLNGLPGTSAYSASKAAVLKLCESYAIDLRKYNLYVTSIGPGFIKTPLTDQNKHPMPFLMDTKTAAHLIIKAINKKKEIYFFPWPMSLIVKFLYHLPRPFYVKMMRFLRTLFEMKKKIN
jgi:short-subunit dehydrogenase